MTAQKRINSFAFAAAHKDLDLLPTRLVFLVDAHAITFIKLRRTLTFFSRGSSWIHACQAVQGHETCLEDLSDLLTQQSYLQNRQTMLLSRRAVGAEVFVDGAT